MKRLSNEQKELNEKQSEVFLYEYGQKYTTKICDETDELYEKYKDLKIPDSLDNWFNDYNSSLKKKDKKLRRKKRYMSIGRKAAIITIAIIFVFSSLTIGDEGFRIRFFNFFFIDKQQYTELSIEEDMFKDVLPEE